LVNLALHILFCVCFALIAKHAQHRGLRLLPVGAVNYFVAALLSGVWAGSDGLPDLRSAVLAVGVFGGVAYVGSYVFFIPVVHSHGISISSAVLRLSQLLPVLYAMACWGERMTGWQAAGLVFFCLAVPLLAHSGNSCERHETGIRSMAILAGLFLVTGLCGIAAKWFDGIGLAEERGLFLFILFSAAAVVSAGLLVGRRVLPDRSEVSFGLFLGLSNVLANFFLLRALHDLKGIVVFPVASAGIIVVTAVLAITCWKEKVSDRGIYGIAMASVAVVFLNLK
jgi:drug/metabolite transporter (DMT)-like permease